MSSVRRVHSAIPRHTLNERNRLQSRAIEKPSYRVIAIGLYEDQACSLDDVTRRLQEAGFTQASRSFIVQTLIRRLQDEIQGQRSPQEILELFLRSFRRPLSLARPSKPVIKKRTGVIKT